MCCVAVTNSTKKGQFKVMRSLSDYVDAIVISIRKTLPGLQFRQIPLDPKDIPLLGFVVNNQLYFHMLFPFGLRSAIMVCHRVTKAVIHILNTEGYLADVYIDDFYGIEIPELAGVAFNRMTELFEELGLEASPAKDHYQTPKCLCLEFGSIRMI